MANLSSTLLLTLLLAIGLVFFLRAASKDRTTVVEVHSPRPALEVLAGLSETQRVERDAALVQVKKSQEALAAIRGEKGWPAASLEFLKHCRGS